MKYGKIRYFKGLSVFGGIGRARKFCCKYVFNHFFGFLLGGSDSVDVVAAAAASATWWCCRFLPEYRWATLSTLFNNNKDEDKSSVEREELVDAEEDVSHTDTLKEGDYYNESVDMVISSKEQPAKPSSIQSGFTTMYKKLDPKKKFESMMLATSTKKEEA